MSLFKTSSAAGFASSIIKIGAYRQDGEALRVAGPTPFNTEWLEHKLHGRVRSTLERLGYGVWQVASVVETAA